MISSACTQSLFRFGAPVSIEYGYFACVPEHTRVMDVPCHCLASVLSVGKDSRKYQQIDPRPTAPIKSKHEKGH
eukprot:gene4487-biopygen12627